MTRVEHLGYYWEREQLRAREAEESRLDWEADLRRYEPCEGYGRVVKPPAQLELEDAV